MRKLLRTDVSALLSFFGLNIAFYKGQVVTQLTTLYRSNGNHYRPQFVLILSQSCGYMCSCLLVILNEDKQSIDNQCNSSHAQMQIVHMELFTFPFSGRRMMNGVSAGCGNWFFISTNSFHLSKNEKIATMGWCMWN